LLVGLASLIVPSKIHALTISEEELARLEQIFKELETSNSKLQVQLNDSTALLQKANQSFNEYASAAEKTAFDLLKEKQALSVLRDRWRSACLWGGVGSATAISILVVFLVLK
jgi:cell division septum initiation protein DivIVA